METIIIAAMSENRAIGINNTLPWAIKGDLERFKRLTMGFPCIMGRKTWDSLPKRPLPGRTNIIVSSELAEAEGATVARSLPDALGLCAGSGKAFICGGATVYREALAFADRLEITLVRRHVEGDAFFPEIDPNVWTQSAIEEFDDFSFVSYARIKPINAGGVK
ncbi:MAG: dihydrofolate reductase [Treponema sp.]|nr:dihydrofolate reductase [Treponema sp.]